MKSVTIFCGSNFGRGESYRHAALLLGREIAARDLTMVYGGTNKGLMGVLADAVLEAGGRVRGVITQRLVDKGHRHPGLEELEIVTTMRERKTRMAEMGDAYIAMPGGAGTLEEFFEVWVAAQLEGVAKPLALYNVNAYYEPLVHMVEHMIAEQFLPAGQRDMILIESEPTVLLDACKHYKPVAVSKWL